MRFRRLHAAVAYLLAFAGFLGLSLGRELSIVSVAFFFVGGAASLLVPFATRQSPGYQKLWNWVLSGYLVLGIARAILGTGMLELGLELAGMLQVIKLFQRRSARDFQQMQVLAFLHLIAATILSTGMEYGGVFVAYIILIPWMFALTHLRTEIERHYSAWDGAAPGEEAASPTVQKVLDSKMIAGWRYLAATAVLSIPLFAVTATLFLLIPRVGVGFLTLGEHHGRQVSGFGTEVSLGDFGTIRQDATVIMRVRPANLPSRPERSRSFRLRGTSFSDYAGARWSRSVHERVRTISGTHGTVDLVRARRPNDEVWTVMLDPIDPPVLFLPLETVSIHVPPKVDGEREIQRTLLAAEDREIRYLDAEGTQLRYDVAVPRSGEFMQASLSDFDRQRYLEIPPGLERVAELAKRLAGEGTETVRARRMENWLKESGDIQYSLRQPDTTGRDPLLVFLFEAKRGHCEYFSTALAMMLRTQGIPSRNVTGFVGGDYNEYGKYYAVRQGDAHSWVEAYLDNSWVTLDPTPGTWNDTAAQEDGLLAEFRAFVDAMRTRWDRDVVGYDIRRQANGLRDLMSWLRSERDTDEPTENADRSRPEQEEVPRAALAGFALLVMLAGVFALWWSRRRKEGEEEELPEAAQLYVELEDVLRKLGKERPTTRTPREHASLLREEGFLRSAQVEEVTEAYLSSRFGQADLPPKELARLKEVVKYVAVPPEEGRRRSLLPKSLRPPPPG